MKNWFERDVRQSVEDRFSQLAPYKLMRSVALQTMQQSCNFALHPADLFYHAMVTIDLLRSRDSKTRSQYCGFELWDDLYFEFLEVDDTQDDINRATALVMITVANFIYSSGNPQMVSPAGILTCQVERHVTGIGDQLELLFKTSLNRYEEEVRTFMQQYLPSGRMISEEVELLIDETKASAASGVVKTIAEDSGIRLAEGKETALMVTLTAMYNDGWFVDANGKKISSRDTAISQIMKHAFGQEPKDIRQKLQNAKAPRHYGGMKSYLEDLISHLPKE